ncbi:MAG: amidohydrolase family protein [Paracoccus sp. (in: a-proteobacteria)]|nr:amidohydrolase family protein [Paracoccus sp. (in: a-proteobacteria)]
MTMPDFVISEPMLPLDGLSPPSFEMPKGACDTHIHIFGPESVYQPVAQPLYTLPDGKLDHFLALMPILKFERFVIVQPSFYGTDNSCLLDALREAGGEIARGVVMIDEDITPAELARMHEAGVRGVRLDLFSRRTWPQADIRAYITRMAALVAPLGWHLQFYVPGYVIRDLVDFLPRIPVPHVIDHMGYMLASDGLGPDDFARLLARMNDAQTYLKLSGPYRIAKEKGYGAVLDIARAIVDTNPDRAIWGSDWPHIPKSGRDTGELVNLLAQWAPDATDRRKILTDNPARLFGWPE